MDNLSVIKILKKPAINIMKDKKILASFIISSALYYLNSVSESDAVKLCNAHNVMKRKANSRYNNDFILLDSPNERGYRFKTYDSYEDCIEDWLLTFRSGRIRQIWDFNTAIAKLSNKEFTKSNLLPLVTAYKLTDIDKEVLNEMYPSNQTIVEVSPRSNASAYQKMSGYKPTISANSAVNKVAPKPAIKVNPATYSKGELFAVKSVNIFYDATASTAIRSHSGNVWLYDGKMVNDRYAIVTNKEHLDKEKEFIDGYIKKTDLDKGIFKGYQGVV